MLLCIDMQNDFITGSLSVNGADEMMHTFTDYISRTKLSDFDEISFTQDWHPENHISFIMNGGEFPRHCTMNSCGAALYDDILTSMNAIGKNYKVYHKGTDSNIEEYSIFSRTTIDSMNLKLKCKEMSEIDICGIADKYCVKSTILDLINEGMKNKLKVLTDFIGYMGDKTEFIEWLDKLNIKHE